MLCGNCGGECCDRCNYYGRVPITSCPKKQITPDVWEAMELYGFVDKGAWPIGGGTLNQCAAFLDFVRQVSAEDQSWRARALTGR